MHFLASGPSLFGFLSHILGNVTAALWWLVQVFPFIKEIWLQKPQGPNPLYPPPWGVTLVHSKKQARASRNTRGHAPNQNLQPAGDQVAALTLADVTAVYFAATNRIKSSGTNRPPPWLFLWGVYWLSVYKHCRVANFHVFIWCESGCGVGGGQCSPPQAATRLI